ncbi:MAG: TIGR02301 family protein [Filomicrobium sp.]
MNDTSTGLATRKTYCQWPKWLVGKLALMPLLAMTVLFGSAGFGAPAQSADQTVKAYDTKLLRLSEIIGAVHYLRELCGAGDGQLWRDQMQELLKAEGASALRRARLTRSFNKGYQSYSRTYKVCTTSAQTAISRFLDEGTEIAEGLVKSNP